MMFEAQGPCRILVIEDDPGTQRLIAQRLKRLGHEVVIASNCKEASRILLGVQATFDLVLLDYMLPDANAETLVSSIWEKVGNPKFIVLTGHGDERVAVKLMKLGAEDYIVKDAEFFEHMESSVERTLRHVHQEHELTRTESLLRDSEDRLNLALQAAGISVWDINVQEMTAIIDERWAMITGKDWPAGLATFEAVKKDVHPDDLLYIERRWNSYLQRVNVNIEFEASYRIIHPEKGERWIDQRGIVVERDHENRPLRIISTLADVTDKMRMREIEEQLLRAQRMDTLGTLAGGIAHDFNNVLAAIMGYNELIQRNPTDRSSVVYCADNINRASKRAKEIIRQILLFSRRSEPEILEVDLVKLVDESVGFIRAVAPPSVTIRTHYEVDDALVLADEGQISQVITNLLNNAVYAVKGVEGMIDLRIRQQDANGSQLQYCVDVQDNGKGIPAGIRDRIFEPFYTTKPKGQGTGLGLATSQGIIMQHSGRITVQSEEGKGTLFTVTLPKAREVEEAVEPDIATSPETPSTLSILLVDDEIALAEVTSELLSLNGYQVDVYHDPLQALASFRSSSHVYDLAICDYNMPRKNGFELISELRAIHPDLTCLLVTGELDKEKLEDIRKVNKLHTLLKPFTHDELLDAINRALPEKQPSRML